MTKECPFYCSESKPVRSKQVTGSRSTAPGSIATYMWCKHKHSPMDYKKARISLGGGINCGGVLNNCPIKDIFDDV